MLVITRGDILLAHVILLDLESFSCGLMWQWLEIGAKWRNFWCILIWLVVSNIFSTYWELLGIIIPIDFHSFQRGRYTTNQWCILIIDGARDQTLSIHSSLDDWAIPKVTKSCSPTTRFSGMLTRRHIKRLTQIYVPPSYQSQNPTGMERHETARQYVE